MFFKLFRKFCLFTIISFLMPLGLYANTPKYADFFSNWSDGFFADLGVHSYIPVGGIHEYAFPKAGFRAGLGYHLFNDYNHSVLFAVNSGWTFISGTNPLVRTLDLVPLVFFAEYNFSPVHFFSVNAGAGCGMFFSSVSRYKTAVALIQNDLAYENNQLFFIHANLGTSFKFLRNSFSVCLDFGVDLLPENDGPIPLPYVSISTKFYPFRIAKYPKMHKVEKVEKIIEYSKEKVFIYPDEINSITKIYFSANSTELWDSYKPVLNYLALYLKGLAKDNNNPENKKDAEKKFSVVLTGYSAPFGMEDEMDDIAEQRARVIMEYLENKTKFADDSFLIRIKTADFDVEGLPQKVTNDDLQKYRVVEIKIRDKSNNLPKAQNETKPQDVTKPQSETKPQNETKAQNEAKQQTKPKKVFNIFSSQKESKEQKAVKVPKAEEAKRAKEALKAKKAKEAKKALKAKKAAEAKKAKEIQKTQTEEK